MTERLMASARRKKRGRAEMVEEKRDGNEGGKKRADGIGEVPHVDVETRKQFG